MIRHLFELGALMLLFGVGVGLLVAGGAALLMIWRPEFKRSAVEEEYRRVEEAGWGCDYSADMFHLPIGPIWGDWTEGDEKRFWDEIAWLDCESFTGSLDWPSYVPAFPFDWERE